MNEVLGPNTVSVRMLDDWTAPSKVRVRFPLVYVSAFCEATGCDDLQKDTAQTREIANSLKFPSCSSQPTLDAPRYSQMMITRERNRRRSRDESTS